MEYFRDILTGLHSQVPESLLAGQGWSHLLERVGDLPAATVTSLCGFEFRLDEPKPAADFSNPVARDHVRRYYITQGKAAAPASTGAWLARHLTESSGTDHWLESVLLAYDIIDTTLQRPVPPVVYLRLRPGPEAGGVAATSADLAATVAQASAHKDREPVRRTLVRTLDCLPAGARLVYIGATPGRAPRPGPCAPPRAVRLLVADMEFHEVGPLLKRLEWPGSTATVLELLSGMQDLCRRFLFLFDATEDGVSPRLGFEMYPVQKNVTDYRALLAAWLFTSKRDWKPVIRRLVDWQLCLPAKAEGLLAWPRLKTVFGHDGAFQLYMGINHVKLSVDGEHVRAKAYGGLRLLPLGQVTKGAFFHE